MFTKLFIIFIMIIISGFMARGLFSLITDSGNSKRTVRSLSMRIILSLALFIFLFIGFKLGLIHPHDL